MIACCTASLPGGDAQLSVDRADFRADGVAGHEQPLRDLAEGEMGLQVGEKPKLRRAEGRRAGQVHLRSLGEKRAEFRYVVEEGSKGWPAEQNLVDLSQQMVCGRLVGEGGVHHGQLQAHPHGDIGNGEGAGWSGSHGLRELTVHLLPVAPVHCKPGGGGEG